MSHTDRNEKREPRERPFPYVPRGVVIISTGPAYGANDNRAYVRELIKARQPALHAALQAVTQNG